MQVPEQYQGREQSYLKHRVLEEYLLAWGLKLGSSAQQTRVRLCYVDGFAGPWQAQSAVLDDTSIAIGLQALEKATETWRKKGYSIDVDAYFVEKDPRAFAKLDLFLRSREGVVRTTPYQGEFGTHVAALQKLLGTDPGFIFVDPTGWKGAAMRFIAPLLADSWQRDVLVNVMFDHINRFKDDPRKFLREQMREFFGLGDRDMPEALGEDELFALYRRQLKDQCRVRYAADLAIPHPTIERTKFRLVVGGNHPKVLELFRDIEKKVIGAEAAVVRTQASDRASEERTGQTSLFPLFPPPPTDSRYRSLHAEGLTQAHRDVLDRLAKEKLLKYEDLWPGLLEAHHITKTELGKIVWRMYEHGEIRIKNKQPRERSVKDEHLLATIKPGTR